MPHFIVSEIQGRDHYAVEWNYSETTAAGTKRWPVPKAAIEIPECVADLSLDTLIQIYRGNKPHASATIKERALFPRLLSEKDTLLVNIATVKLRKADTNAHQTD